MLTPGAGDIEGTVTYERVPNIGAPAVVEAGGGGTRIRVCLTVESFEPRVTPAVERRTSVFTCAAVSTGVVAAHPGGLERAEAMLGHLREAYEGRGGRGRQSHGQLRIVDPRIVHAASESFARIVRSRPRPNFGAEVQIRGLQVEHLTGAARCAFSLVQVVDFESHGGAQTFQEDVVPLRVVQML